LLKNKKILGVTGTSLLVMSTVLTPLAWNHVEAVTNNPPVVSNAVSDFSIELGVTDHVIDLTNIFTDEDGDIITVTPSVVGEDGFVDLNVADNNLNIKGLSVGISTIKLTANDGIDNTEHTFNVEIKDELKLIKPMEAVSDLNEPLDITLSDYFEGTPSYTVTSDTVNVTTVELVGDKLTLTAGADIGYATVTVEGAYNGEIIKQIFRVNVGLLEASKVIPTIEIDSAKMSTTFNLTEYVKGDGNLTYTVEENKNPELVEVIENLNGVITFKGLAKGTAEVVVSAVDEDGDFFGGTLIVEVGELSYSSIFADINTAYGLNVPLIELGNYVNQDGVTFVTTSSENGIVGITSNAQNELKITPLKKGIVKLTVVGTNSVGEKVSQDMNVFVSKGPEQIIVNDAFKDQTISNLDKLVFDLKTNYTDSEGQDLSFKATGFDTKIVDISIDSNDIMTITKKGLGRTNVSLEITDARGKILLVPFSVEVKDDIQLTATIVNKNVLDTFGDTLEVKGTLIGSLSAYTVEFKVGNADVGTSVLKGTNFTQLIKAEEIGAGRFSKVTVVVKNPVNDVKLYEKDIFFNFEVKESAVKTIPVLKTKINDVTENIGHKYSINLNDHFSDASNSDLTYTVNSSNSKYVSSTLNKNLVDIKLNGLGESTITVEAKNKFEQKISTTFKVIVKNNLPEIKILNNDSTIVEYGENFNLLGNISDFDKDKVFLTAVLNGVSKEILIDTASDGNFQLVWKYSELKPGTFNEVQLFLKDGNEDNSLERNFRTNILVKDKDPEPVVEKPVIEKPVVEKPVVEKPVVEKPVIEKPVVEKPITKLPSNYNYNYNSGSSSGSNSGSGSGSSYGSNSNSGSNSGDSNKVVEKPSDKRFLTFEKSDKEKVKATNEIQLSKTGLLITSEFNQGEKPDFYVYYTGDNKDILANDYKLEVFKTSPSDVALVKIKEFNVKGSFVNKDFVNITEESFKDPGSYAIKLVLTKNGTELKSWDKEIVVVPSEVKGDTETVTDGSEDSIDNGDSVDTVTLGDYNNDTEVGSNKLLYAGIASALVLGSVGGFFLLRRRLF
jgi:hypothetical protein